jgi:DNA processing protein
MAANNLKYLLALLQIDGIGDVSGKKLWDKFPNLENLFSESSAALLSLGLSQEIVNAIKKPNWESVERAFLWSEQQGHNIVDFKNQSYPKLLQQIADPPLVLFVDGSVERLQATQIAIVGSRNPTSNGEETAFIISKELSTLGITIASGLAVGIDAASHLGAIEGDASTIAVMGTGINEIYPRKHKVLAEKIIAHGGTLVSGFPFATKPLPKNFPQRNRIISGLSLGTLVVEATLQSGSLITAKCALEQNREVFAIPGAIYNPLSQGCNHLIKQGAKLVTTLSDIIEELNILVKKTNCNSIIIMNNATADKNSSNKETLDLDCAKLLDCVDFEVTPIDSLVKRSGFPVKKVASLLFSLELKNYVKSVIGGYVKLISKRKSNEI